MTKSIPCPGIKITVGTFQLSHAGFNLMENILRLHHHVLKQIHDAVFDTQQPPKKIKRESVRQQTWINFSPFPGILTVQLYFYESFICFFEDNIANEPTTKSLFRYSQSSETSIIVIDADSVNTRVDVGKSKLRQENFSPLQNCSKWKT